MGPVCVTLDGQGQYARNHVQMELMVQIVLQNVYVTMVLLVIMLMEVAPVRLVGGDIHATVLAEKDGMVLDVVNSVTVTMTVCVIQ